MAGEGGVQRFLLAGGANLSEGERARIVLFVQFGLMLLACLLILLLFLPFVGLPPIYLAWAYGLAGAELVVLALAFLLVRSGRYTVALHGFSWALGTGVIIPCVLALTESGLTGLDSLRFFMLQVLAVAVLAAFSSAWSVVGFSVSYVLLQGAGLITASTEARGVYISVLLLEGMAAALVGGFGLLLRRRVENTMRDMHNGIAENAKQNIRIKGILEIAGIAASELVKVSARLSTSAEAFARGAQHQAVASEEIAATSEQMTAAMEGISSNADGQNASADALAKGMEDLSAMMGSTRLNLEEMLERARTIVGEADSGKASLAAIRDMMGTIGQRAREMNGIIETIREISDQIGLLSLNASIEAARAGEAGRGFAVVAEAVSSLSERTNASVKSIGGLIHANSVEIQKGTEAAAGAVSTVGAILDGINFIATSTERIDVLMVEQMKSGDRVVREVADLREKSVDTRMSASEQKSASLAIAQAIQTMNDDIQAAASGSRDMASSAQELALMASELQQLFSADRG